MASKAFDNKGYIGGFCGQNNGIICDCFSAIKIKKSGSAGFAGENTGVLSKCFYTGTVGKLAGGLTGFGSGSIDNCYFFHGEAENSKKLDRLRDKKLGVQRAAIEEVREENRARCIAEVLGFDTEKVWEYVGGEHVLGFNPAMWFHNVEKSANYKDTLFSCAVRGTNPDITRVTNADRLVDIAEKINSGNTKMAAAHICLETDIDLGGREWRPIGVDLSRAFTGIFNGNGYKVVNFKIKNKDAKAKGFFGYLKGEVYNLALDCNITAKDGVAGGITAFCEGGSIGYCAAILELKCGRGVFGGLVGVNTGRVFNSFTAGILGGMSIL